MSKSVNGAIDFFNKKAKTDDVWGLYIDIKDQGGEAPSDYAIFGKGEDGSSDVNKSKFSGPFSSHVDRTHYEWISFYDVSIEKGTEMLAEFIWNVYNEGDNMSSGEEYWHLNQVDNDDTKYEELGSEDQSYINVTKTDQGGEKKNEIEYQLRYGPDDSSVLSGPVWLTFKGDDLVFVANGISQNDPAATEKDFDKLMDETYKRGLPS
jgi:hypothetical protein